MKVQAATRLKATEVEAASITLDPWAKSMLAAIKKGDKNVDSDSMNYDGYYTSEAKGKAIIKALTAAGYKGKKNSSGGMSFESKEQKGHGVTVDFDEDEEEPACIFFYKL
jgi:hypothetical protein